MWINSSSRLARARPQSAQVMASSSDDFADAVIAGEASQIDALEADGLGRAVSQEVAQFQSGWEQEAESEYSGVGTLGFTTEAQK